MLLLQDPTTDRLPGVFLCQRGKKNPFSHREKAGLQSARFCREGNGLEAAVFCPLIDCILLLLFYDVVP